MEFERVNTQQVRAMANYLGISDPSEVMMYGMTFSYRPPWFEKATNVIHRFNDFKNVVISCVRGYDGGIRGIHQRYVAFNDMIYSRSPIHRDGRAFVPLYFRLAQDINGRYEVQFIGIDDYYGSKDMFENFISGATIDQKIAPQMTLKRGEVKGVLDFADLLL